MSKTRHSVPIHTHAFLCPSLLPRLFIPSAGTDGWRIPSHSMSLLGFSYGLKRNLLCCHWAQSFHFNLTAPMQLHQMYFPLPFCKSLVPQWVSLNLHQFCSSHKSKEKKRAERLEQRGIGSGVCQCHWIHHFPTSVLPPPYSILPPPWPLHAYPCLCVCVCVCVLSWFKLRWLNSGPSLGWTAAREDKILAQLRAKLAVLWEFGIPDVFLLPNAIV